MIKCHANINLMTNSYSAGLTPLMIAIKNRDFILIDLLLSYGVDTNVQDKGGWGAVHWASDLGLHEIIHKLFNSGCNLSAETATGHTAINFARSRGHKETAILLEELTNKVGSTKSAKFLA
jgi:ankyrin repeat protein